MQLIYLALSTCKHLTRDVEGENGSAEQQQGTADL